MNELESSAQRRAHRERWRNRITTIGCLALGIFLSRCNFGSTTANVGNPPNSVSLANNAWHGVVVFPYGDPAGLRGHLVPMMQAYDIFTDLIVAEEFSVNAADVVAFQGSYGFGGNPLAWVNCPPNAIVSGADPNRTCYGQTMTFDTSVTPFLSAHVRDAMVCHEFGHTVGLRHVNPASDGSDWNSCMQATLTEATPSGISQHDLGHINSQY